MKEIGLACLAYDQERQASVKRKLFSWAFRGLKKTGHGEFFSARELYEDLRVYFIRLPQSPKDLKKALKKAGKLMAGIGGETGPLPVFLPLSVYEAYRPEGAFRPPYGDMKLLFRSLLIDIINAISRDKGIRLEDMNIAVVQGEAAEELHSTVQRLSALVKYLDIITPDKESLRDSIDRVLFDTGLPVVLREETGCLKKAHIVINLGGLGKYFTRFRINPEAVVVNYGSIPARFLSLIPAIVEGIEVALPKEIISKLDKNVLRCYTGLELAEIILCSRYGIKSSENKGVYDAGLLEGISRVFKKDGYRLTGLTGRHGAHRVMGKA